MPMFVCLSVCLFARLLRNTCMYLDKMLRVDRCHDMDELINFLSRIRIIVRMPEPDCFLRYRICAAMRNFTLGKSWRAATASHDFKMVLFTELSEHLCRR